MRFCNIFSIIAVANSFRMQRMGTNPKFGNRISLKTSLSMESDAIPHGGVLVNTMITSKQDIANAILKCDYEVELDERQLCDVELIMQGGFSPLTGYMD